MVSLLDTEVYIMNMTSSNKNTVERSYSDKKKAYLSLTRVSYQACIVSILEKRDKEILRSQTILIVVSSIDMVPVSIF